MDPGTAHRLTSRLLIALAAAWLGLHLVHDVTDFGDAAFDSMFAAWYQPVTYVGCAAVIAWRKRSASRERLGWLGLSGAIVLYAAGSVVFNVAFGDGPAPPFPSVADGLWLAFYPAAFASIALLSRRRFAHVRATLWLDGLTGGAVVAALAAAVVFQPVFDVTVANGIASVARLGYPLGDLLPVGIAVVAWSLGARRLNPFWGLIGAGFLTLAIGDSVYVVQAARGAWAPGGLLDYPYVLAFLLLAGAAWASPDDDREPDGRQRTRVLLPAGFGLAAVALSAYGLLGELNPLAEVMTVLTLLAVVLRFGLTLAWLTRRSTDLAEQATTDPLTGLANHRALHDRLATEIDRAHRLGGTLSVVAFDIDHFKALNDTYGHTEGDVALQLIADVLREQCRPYDLVGRVGGEEFTLLLPEVDADGAAVIAERCRAEVSRLTIQGSALSCSAGVASFPADDPDGHRLLELADGALYWAKRAGRAQVRRYDPREVVLLSGADQQDQVRRVLEDPDALTPVFQPIVELPTGRIGGYEALTRFEGVTPVRAPDLWFAQARRCGLGAALEARAIERSLAVPGRPAGAFLSLNVSPGALLSPEVAAVLPRDLTGIVIELTEDELFSSDHALDVELAALRARGARIAVDDAGAGYAGLQQVIRISPDILKLDRSLVTDLHVDGSKMALLEALSHFAATTGAAVCGEGIEEVEELRALAGFDVMYAQGYLLGRPGPAWPGIDTAVAQQVSAEERWGMRLSSAAVAEHGPVSLGYLMDALAVVRSMEDLGSAVALLERITYGDEVVVSRVRPGERWVESLGDHDWTPTGERFHFDDYPTTEQVVREQVLGQVLRADPAADPAEVALLERSGHGAVLMAPILFRGATVGLLEIYRRALQPWTRTQVDQARLVANHLGPILENAGGWEGEPESDLSRQA